MRPVLKLVACENCGLPTGCERFCEGCDPLLRDEVPTWARFLFDPEARREHGRIPLAGQSRHQPTGGSHKGPIARLLKEVV